MEIRETRGKRPAEMSGSGRDQCMTVAGTLSKSLISHTSSTAGYYNIA